jgi:chemotaxis protein methyltransferase WspC
VLCEPTRSCPADALELIDALANQGDLTGALSQITERLQRLGASADLYHRRGHLQMALGNAQAAIEDYRRTLYLAPDDYVARYWYALAARQAGDLELARRQLAMIRDGETQVPEELRHSAAHLIGELKCR